MWLWHAWQVSQQYQATGYVGDCLHYGQPKVKLHQDRHNSPLLFIARNAITEFIAKATSNTNQNKIDIICQILGHIVDVQ